MDISRLVTYLSERKSKLCVLATSSKDNQPHVSVLKYAVLDDFTMIVCTHTDTIKWNHIMENPSVALIVGTSFDDLYVQIHAKAELVKPGNNSVYDEFFKVHPYVADYKNDPKVVLIVVKPTWVRTTDFTVTPKKTEESQL